MQRKALSKYVFNGKVKQHYKTLLSKYASFVASAGDKVYAKAYYAQVLFLDNPLLPKYSVLFEELKASYTHFYKLNAESAFEQALDHLPSIREKTGEAMGTIRLLHEFNQEVRLHNVYSDAISNGRYTPEELFDSEKAMLVCSDEGLMNLLALYGAGQELYKRYGETKAQVTAALNGHDVNHKKYKHRFTRKQQVLALYILITSLGVNLRNQADQTKMAALFHLFMGVPFEHIDKIRNLSIYKSLIKAPDVSRRDKELKKNLELIRPYFEQSNFTDALVLIDKYIKMCEIELR